MVIVDTSIWVDSWRDRDERLDGWIAADSVLQHPFVTAELSMGSFGSVKDRSRTIVLLDSLIQIPVATDEVFHAFVAKHSLFGTGIGFADAHLLHACKSNPGAKLATRDKRLGDQARRIDLLVLD